MVKEQKLDGVINTTVGDLVELCNFEKFVKSLS